MCSSGFEKIYFWVFLGRTILTKSSANNPNLWQRIFKFKHLSRKYFNQNIGYTFTITIFYINVSQFTDTDLDITESLQRNFFFVLERIVLKHAIKIVKFHHDLDVQHYLEDNKEIKTLTIICSKQLDMNFRIKQMLYELYCFSFCNANVLKLCNVICMTWIEYRIR